MRCSTPIATGAAVLACLSSALPAQAPVSTFRSSTEVVLVPAWVTDKNRPVLGLTPSDFQLLDNGVVQEISIVTADSYPVDVTLALDTSGSLTGAALNTLKAGVQQIAHSLRPTDAVRLITFATSITDVFGVRAGGTHLPVERIEGGGHTSFYDALAAALIAVPRSGRPQLVFGLSDGLDNLSFLDARQIVALAESSAASLYVALVRQLPVPRISTSRFVPTPPLDRPNVNRLREATARTGGVLYEYPVGTTLPVLFSRVLEDFRTSYLLSYTPLGVRGGVHEIVVQTKDRRYTVRSRKGYRN